MKTRRPIQAKSTSRLIKSVFPEEFKINQENSTGYKVINLLYGVEVDEIRDRMQSTYDNAFLDSFDLSQNGYLYEMLCSGYLQTDTITGDGISIKLTNQDEFDNGVPTRFLKTTNDLLDLSGNNIIGLEYLRHDGRGSGQLLVNFDYDQTYAELNNLYTHYKYELSPLGEVQSSGISNPGIQEQSFEALGFDEILSTIDSGNLRKLYPETRIVTDISGVNHTIDYYEPYNGWYFKENGIAIANILAYDSDYYYDDEGNKIYYRTAYNNPNGYLNYNTNYINLQNIPISGSLKVFDIDILDISGNATEIPQTGINLYYYQASGMLDGIDGGFDPIYVGYDDTVPYNRGFDSAGQPANLLTNVSWDYQKVGSYIDEGTFNYIEGSGVLTNKIKINNPQSRYLVTYNYVNYNKVKYITSLDSSKFIRLATTNPIMSIENTSNNYIIPEWNFSKDVLRSHDVLTFDGLKLRPGSTIQQLDVEAPGKLDIPQPLNQNTSVSLDGNYLGFSNQFKPIINRRNYYLDINFKENNLIEYDNSSYNNNLTYLDSGVYSLNLINYLDGYGKKINYTSGESYYYMSNAYATFYNYHIGFILNTPQSGTLIEVSDLSTNKIFSLKVNNSRQIYIESNTGTFYSKTKYDFDNNYKDIILKVTTDEFKPEITLFELYMKSGNNFYQIHKLSSSTSIIDDPTITYTHFFKNLSVDIGYAKIFKNIDEVR